MSGVAQFVSSGPLLLALPVAAAAGAVTFLSPCCLPLVPGYLSFITGMTGAGTGPASSDGTGPGGAGGRGGAGPDAGPDGAGPDAGPDGAGPDGAGPDGAGPDGAGPDGAGPDGAGSGAPALAGALGGGGGPGVVVVAAPVAAAPPARPPRSRVVAATGLFVLGFSLVFAVEGAAIGGVGRLLIGHSDVVTRVLGGLTIVLGLMFAGVFDRFSFAGRIFRPSARPKAGLAGAPLLGVMFGVGWTPCTGPTLSAVLGLAAGTGTAPRGAILAFVYALGLGIPFLFIALGFQIAVRASAFARAHARTITIVGGALLVCVGILEVTGAWTVFLGWLKVHWIGNYEAPI